MTAAKRALAETDLRVVSQGGRLYCLETEDRSGLFQTRPDVLVKRGDEVVQIIDTKWKRIAVRMDDPKRGVSQGDVYQMTAYGQVYKCDRLTLLYPHHTAINRGDGVHAAHQVTGCSHRLETATIDIGRGEMLSERLRAITALRPESAAARDQDADGRRPDQGESRL
jgi:5-methylcytosine-specific restriction enzyme subunit McrC